MSRARLLSRLAVLASVCLWTGVSHACAVCVTPNERNRLAFFLTTIFLTLLPLGLIGAGLVWLARHGREALAGEFDDRDETVPVPDPQAEES